MSTKSRLSATALLTLVAMSAMAATSANAAPLDTSNICRGAVNLQACGVHLAYLEHLRKHQRRDTTHALFKDTDPRYNQAMRDAGGGGGGGGGGAGGGR